MNNSPQLLVLSVALAGFQLWSPTVAAAQSNGGVSFAFDAGVSAPVARDLGWDSRSKGVALEATFTYVWTRHLELRAGMSLTRSAFDAGFYEESIWFPFESPTTIHAHPTNIYSILSGAAFRVVQVDRVSLYAIGEAGYGWIQMPPISHEFGADVVSMSRDNRHGVVYGFGAGASFSVSPHAALRLEVTSRSLLIPNSQIGDYTHTARNSVDQAIVRIGLARSIGR